MPLPVISTDRPCGRLRIQSLLESEAGDRRADPSRRMAGKTPAGCGPA
jgi:hypothetical protein